MITTSQDWGTTIPYQEVIFSCQITENYQNKHADCYTTSITKYQQTDMIKHTANTDTTHHLLQTDNIQTFDAIYISPKAGGLMYYI